MDIEKKTENKIDKRKKRAALITAIALILMFTSAGCIPESCSRNFKSCSSDLDGGLERTVKVYSQTGELIAEYEGKFDIEESENKVLFDLDGKRIIIYNALVITEEK